MVSPSDDTFTALVIVSKGVSRLPSLVLSPLESTYQTGPKLIGPHPADKQPIKLPFKPPSRQGEFSRTK